MLADQAALKLCKILTPGSRILDVGSGQGGAAKFFEEKGFEVTAISLPLSPGVKVVRPPDIIGDFLEAEFHLPFDAVWASHVLEHQVNPGLFLDKCRRLLSPEGVAAITVPPLKHEIVGGHVTLWNAGVLLYQMVLAGFDCCRAQIKSYGYNISVVAKQLDERRLHQLRSIPLMNDIGDIERLARFFPTGCRHQSFNGSIQRLNWTEG